MSKQNPSYTNPEPCKHLADYKHKHGLNGFKTLQNCLKTTPYGRTSVSKHESETPRCSLCFGYQGRFYFCLICSSIACSGHANEHSQSNRGHEIAVDVERAELYCCVCCDQVYDPDFDRAVVSKQFMHMPGNVNGAEGVVEESNKKRRLGLGLELEWRRSKRLVSMADRRSKSIFPLGLRGLNNLGSTCFMNSVLQALLQAPPLRNYFLNDRHNRQSCRKKSADRLCLPCDIDVIFSAVFSGDRTPYSPAQFLYSWWQLSENLASYEQQDAHEFFISMLDQIHEKEGKSKHQNKDNRDCQCIAHKAFSGLLRSDVTCTTCGFTSTTYDPYVDISLNLDMSFCPSTGTSKPNENASMSTLLGCLDLFTRPEKLGPDQKLYCQNCQERRNSVKQMSIRKLPVVLCLHIKRFEHSPIRKMSRKIDQYLQFPFSLDMTPYLSSTILRNRFGNRIFAFEEGDESDTCTEYEIFAVVTHSGMLDSGHYVTYVRVRNQWYKCNDAWITEVDEGVVRASQCYLMYYVQKGFHYKASEDLSCFPMYPPGGESYLQIAGCC